jgi:hypothetical protein
MKDGELSCLSLQAMSVENDNMIENVVMSDQIGVKDAVTRELLVEVCSDISDIASFNTSN